MNNVYLYAIETSAQKCSIAMIDDALDSSQKVINKLSLTKLEQTAKVVAYMLAYNYQFAYLASMLQAQNEEQARGYIYAFSSLKVAIENHLRDLSQTRREMLIARDEFDNILEFAFEVKDLEENKKMLNQYARNNYSDFGNDILGLLTFTSVYSGTGYLSFIEEHIGFTMLQIRFMKQ